MLINSQYYGTFGPLLRSLTWNLDSTINLRHHLNVSEGGKLVARELEDMYKGMLSRP